MLPNVYLQKIFPLTKCRSEKGRLLDQLQLPDNDHGLLVAMEGEIAQYKVNVG